jgi:hypothetical protein
MDLSMLGLWNAMGNFAKGIVITMAVMSIYSLTIMVSKWWSLRRAQKETIKFAPEFSQFLEEDNLTEAIRSAESYKKSHVALVLGGALGEVKPLIADGSVTVSGHQLGGARGRAQHAPRDHEPEARHGGARDGRRHGAVRGSAWYDDRYRERVHGHGRIRAPAVSPRSVVVSPRRSSRRRSVFSSPSPRCGLTTTSRRRSTTSLPR